MGKNSLIKMKQQNARWRREGRCQACGGEVAHDRKYCEDHLYYFRQYHANRRAAHRRAGLCIRCDRLRFPGRTMCARHLIENRARAAVVRDRRREAKARELRR